MKFTYAIHPDHRVIFLRYEGRFTTSELVDSIQKLWADPAYSRDYNGIVDATDASVAIDIRDFRAFISLIRDRDEMSVGRWAAVTTSPLATACGFIYKEALAFRHKFQVFSGWEAACDFIELPPSAYSIPGESR